MLGRTASSLFWMSRYHERAQNVSRLLEVACRGAIISHSGQEDGTHWTFALACSGCETGYKQKYEELNGRNVAAHMIFPRKTPQASAAAWNLPGTTLVPFEQASRLNSGKPSTPHGSSSLT